MMDKDPKIIIYSTPSCVYCNLAKQYLSDVGLKFEDINVSGNTEKIQEMFNKSGAMSVPVIDIDGEILIGFDKRKIDKRLGLA